jgi:hypothetical protein
LRRKGFASVDGCRGRLAVSMTADAAGWARAAYVSDLLDADLSGW